MVRRIRRLTLLVFATASLGAPSIAAGRPPINRPVSPAGISRNWTVPLTRVPPAFKPLPRPRPGPTSRPPIAIRPHAKSTIRGGPNSAAAARINNQWRAAIARRDRPLADWPKLHPDRMRHWRDWGDRGRDGWRRHHEHWFDQDWWKHRERDIDGWRFDPALGLVPRDYWRRAVQWEVLSRWFDWWSGRSFAWIIPIYYDYGSGGNVTIANDAVMVGGRNVGKVSDLARSAAKIADVTPFDATGGQAKTWMPLGTFGISTDAAETDLSFAIQLAVNKQGVIAGTFYNAPNDRLYAVLGRVDQKTQRAAFRIGDTDRVVETGLYSLTRDEFPVLVYTGDRKVDVYLLFRLQEPANAPVTP